VTVARQLRAWRVAGIKIDASLCQRFVGIGLRRLAEALFDSLVLSPLPARPRARHAAGRRRRMNGWQGSVRRKSSLGVALFLLASTIALLIACLDICVASEEKAATNMRDVQSHFRDCLQPFHEADGSRIILYFSVKRNGQIFGDPRAVWFGSDVRVQERERILSDFTRAFESCMPLQLNNFMAETIPGKIYYLQFNGGRDGSQIIVKPYGSEGPPIFDDDRW
jgi:hypothetical protein